MAGLIFDKKEVESVIDNIVKRTMRMDLTWDWPGGVAYYGVCHRQERIHRNAQRAR